MNQGELIIVVIIVLLVLMYMLKVSNRVDTILDPESLWNMRHTNIDGVRDSNKPLPSPWTYEPPQFMNARYKVIADDNIGDNIDPLDDMINQRIFKNPHVECPTKHGYSDTSQTFWKTTKSTPTIASDNKQLIHSSAELQTPEHRVQMSKKTKHFLQHTEGRSRLNFTSFENSNSEPSFRQ